MCQRSACPLQALRSCGGLALWPLEQRLEAKAVARRWREAVDDPELWIDLDVPASLAAALPTLLRHYGRYVRRLSAGAQLGAPPEQRFPGLLPGLALCGRLVSISLRGLGGPEFCRSAPPVAVSSLRVLALSYTPYFILSNYSHHTGVPGATVSMDWVVATFPKLEELTCEYLQVGEAPSPLPSLRRLSLVAVVRNSEAHALWGSEGCCRDLVALARAASCLEHLEWRDPRLHLGRMSWRPSQSAEDLCWLCRRFCALDPALLAGARRLLPRLTSLEVATVREEADFDLEPLDLAQFLGLRGAGSCDSAPAVGEPALRLRLGGLAQEFATRWRAAAQRVGPLLDLEITAPPPQGPGRPRTTLNPTSAVAAQDTSLAALLRRRFPAAATDSDEEASASWRSTYGSILGSPAPSSADGEEASDRDEPSPAASQAEEAVAAVATAGEDEAAAPA